MLEFPCVCYSELGQRTEALKATMEAVEYRRELAEKNRDAFLPNLARSLDTLQSIHQSNENYLEAEAAVAEAIELLTPYFAGIPAVFAQLMAELCCAYNEICEKQEKEPDMKLLTPVIVLFEKMKDGETEND